MRHPRLPWAAATPASFRALLRDVRRLRRREELRGQAGRLRELAAALAADGTDPLVTADLSARLWAALVRRLAERFGEERGPAPGPWAWLALGSLGRREQPFPTDQDHALAVADPVAGAAWYGDLARRLEDDLVVAGLPPCPGGTVASSWRAGLSDWCARLRGWMEDPTPAAVLQAAALADARKVAGALSAAPLRAALAGAPAHPRFLRELARAAAGFEPPAALPLRLGLSRVDLQRQGLAPLVLTARALGLAAGAAGAAATGTADRLEAARGAGLLGAEACGQAIRALRFLLGLRLRLSLAAGTEPGPVDPGALAPGERRSLRAALAAARRLQAAGRRRLGLE